MSTIIDAVSESAELVGEATSSDPAVGLRAVRALGRLADTLEELHVGRARALGWSWQQIADELGVSRQAVHKKYGRRGLRGRRASC
ncbi:MAG: helix-turn-helix domain-containing protein [Actinomycetota bacterium]|nr:helix-turn-helix domain-containing protein [Actinomycetota bacterium]